MSVEKPTLEPNSLHAKLSLSSSMFSTCFAHRKSVCGFSALGFIVRGSTCGKYLGLEKLTGGGELELGGATLSRRRLLSSLLEPPVVSRLRRVECEMSERIPLTR